MVKVRGMVVTPLIVLLVTILNPVDTTKSDIKPVAVAKSHVETNNMFYTVKFIEKKLKSKQEKTYYNVPLSSELQQYVHKLCVQYNVDEKLVYAVMKTESGFNPNKISKTGDYGLAQINKVNFPMLEKEIGFSNPLNPFDSSKACVYMLSQLQKRFNNENEVLIGYNGGIGMAEQLISRGIELTDYVIKVKNNMNTIHQIGGNAYEKEDEREVETVVVRKILQ
jgi:soluble lytic murein transglycosylase-like protein